MRLIDMDDVLSIVDDLRDQMTVEGYCAMVERIKALPSAQPVAKDINVPVKDCISRQAAIEALHDEIVRRRISEDTNDDGTLDEFDTEAILRRLPSAQPTLYGYNIEHLILIANVMRKENLPPERVVEALTDIGRIVAIVRDEFIETLRRSVRNIERKTDE